MSGFTTSSAIYSEFAQKLSKVRKKELLTVFASLFFTALSVIVLLILAALILESLFRFGISTRKILYWGILSGSVTTLVYISLSFILKFLGITESFDPVKYSSKIGSFFSEIKDSLANSLSLFRKYSVNPDGSVFSPELINAELERVKERTNGIDLESAIDKNRLKRSALFFAGAVAISLISFAVSGGSLSNAAYRIANYNYGFLDDLGISFTVTPGNFEIARGENADVKAFVNVLKGGLKIDEIKIHYGSFGRTSNSSPVSAAGDNSFAHRFENVQEEMSYYFEYEGIRSEQFKISVADYPAVKNFRLTVRPPSFTGIPEKVQENDGDVFCPQGSELYFELSANKTLSEAGVIYMDERQAFNAGGEFASGSFTAKESGEYTFYLKDASGTEGRNYRKFTLKVLKDEDPKIMIIEPSQTDLEISMQKELLIRSRITDDYGFSGLTLNYRNSAEGSTGPASARFTSVRIPVVNLNATSLEVPYGWDIASLGLKRGGRVEYYLEVTDNAGKSTKSELRSLVFKSPDEAFKKNKEQTKELKNQFESVYDEALELQKEIEELKRKVQRSEDLGLNEEGKRNLEKKLDNFQQNMQSTQKQLQQNMEDMQRSNMLDEKTLEQYMELQEMFNKINTPELQKMLEKMREALRKENPEELREAMKNFKFDEEAFKKYMEKAMELLKKIENMQKFGELTEKLDDITNRQEELKKKTESADQNNTEKMKDLSAEQMMVKDKMNEFSDELKKLIEEMNKMKDQLSAEDLQKLREQMQKKGVQNKMQNSQDQLSKSQKQQSEKTQQDIMDDLNSMNEQMKEALSKMMDSQDMQQKLKEQLEKILKELKEMSKRQQELKDRTDDTEQGDKNEFEKNKQQQGDLQGDLSESINDLMNTTKMGMMLPPELGKELGNAYNKMDKAGKELGDMKKDRASDNQGDAKRSLDNAANMLGQMLAQMGEGNKKGKGNKPGDGNMGQLMQRLGEIIAQQMGLNGKTGKTGENGQQGNDGKGSNPDNIPMPQREEMDRLRLEQMQIQKSMEQLNEELKKEQQRSGEKVFGDMDEVEKEMKDVIKQLSEYNLDDKLKEKQNRILSRMLDARLSQREKDFEPKRESRPGENVSRNSPPEIVLSGPGSYNALREEFLNMQKEGYSAEYEELITKYLLELKKNGINTEQ